MTTEPPVTPPEAESDTSLATRLADEAGRGMLAVRQRLVSGGAHAWQVMDGGDTSSQRFLADELARVRPDDAVLSEEGLEDPRRFSGERVWIIDPLDGTREFGEPGRWDWAVHVALWSSGRFLAGAVSLPALGVTFSTDPPPAVADVRRERPRLVTSRTRAPYAAAVVATASSAGAETTISHVGPGQFRVNLWVPGRQDAVDTPFTVLVV